MQRVFYIECLLGWRAGKREKDRGFGKNYERIVSIFVCVYVITVPSSISAPSGFVGCAMGTIAHALRSGLSLSKETRSMRCWCSMLCHRSKLWSFLETKKEKYTRSWLSSLTRSLALTPRLWGLLGVRLVSSLVRFGRGFGQQFRCVCRLVRLLELITPASASCTKCWFFFRRM